MKHLGGLEDLIPFKALQDHHRNMKRLKTAKQSQTCISAKFSSRMAHLIATRSGIAGIRIATYA